jgi:Ca2+-binding RTX toxin-like protein
MSLGRRNGRSARIAAAGVLVSSAVAAQLLISAPSAHAFTSCSFDDDTNVESVTSTASEINIRRDQDTIEVEGIACGSVQTVDTVAVDLNFQESVTLVFDLGGGAFANGATLENDGSSEIEFTVTEMGQVTRARVIGTDGDDSISFGDRDLAPLNQIVTEINLNAAVDGANPDEDVRFAIQPSDLTVLGEGGNDVLTGAGLGAPGSLPTGRPMLLVDGPGTDSLTGGANSDEFFTDDGDAGDAFSGRGREDFIDYSHAPAGVTVSLDNKPNDGGSCPAVTCEGDNVKGDIEFLVGTPFNDNFTGNARNNFFDPGGGTNALSGGGGDDVFFEGGGKDDFAGGPGFDRADYQRDDTGVTVTLDGLPNDGPPGAHDNVRPDVESVSGGRGNDNLVGNAKANVLRGVDGNDTINGAGGNDVLEQPTGNFFLNDSDVLIGGPGVDTADYHDSTANLTLSLDGKANDQAVGDPSLGVDNIHADVENVIGGTKNDRITGSAAANRLTGGAGNDMLIGLDGKDVLIPGAGDDAARGGPGLDVASFVDAPADITADLVAGTATGDGDDTLGTIERLIGSAFGDHLVGSLGPNRLDGRGGNDVLKGLLGNDVLLGGPGNDNLDGGQDSDTCRQGPGSGSVTHCEH